MTLSGMLFRPGQKRFTRLSLFAAVAVLLLVISGLVVGLILVHQPGSSAIGANSHPTATAVLAALNIYALSRSGLVKLDTHTGKTLWTYSQAAPSGPPTIVDGTVYFRPQNDAVYALNAQDGSLRWRSPLPGGNVSFPPAVANGLVYVGGSFDATLYALDSTDGSVRWKAPTPAGEPFIPAVADGLVYVSALTETSALYAFDAQTGALQWQAQPLADQHFDSPRVVNGVVYLDSVSNSHHTTPEPHDAYLYAFDAKSGALLWHSQQFPSGDFGVFPPMITNGVVCFGAEDGFVYALDARTGTHLWRHNTGSSLLPYALVDHGTVYLNDLIGNSAANLTALNIADGSVRWHSSRVGIPLAVAEGTLYLGADNVGRDANVTGINVVDGATRWHTKMQAPAFFYGLPGGVRATVAP